MTWKVRDDVVRNHFQTVIPLDDFHLLGEALLQLFLLRIVEILVLQDLIELVAQVIVLNVHLRHPLLVEQGHSGPVIHGLAEIIFGNIVTKPFVCLTVPPE